MSYTFQSSYERLKLVLNINVQRDGSPMTAEWSNNPITKIGRYRITGELGRGGIGIVYQGEDRLIGRRVAITTLTEVTPELRERFYLEARSGILSHPNIVTVYELGEHEGSPFIAMEFIEGDSLEKLLREQNRPSLLEALSIVEQICAGLGYAHGHGVVHRDVKPANILVQPDGRVAIVDFGIARLADQTKQLTKTDTLLGTFHYIAPERLKGAAARKTCESSRKQKATQLLQGAIQAAQLQLRNNSAKRVGKALMEVEYALPHAAPDVRNDWKRLKVECETPLLAKQPASTSGIPAKRGKVRLYAMGATIAVASLAIGKVLYPWHGTPAQAKPLVVCAPASAPAASSAISTDLVINASPWAKVVSVEDKSGKSTALPGRDSNTPLRLDAVDGGVYEVTLAGPDNKQQTVECRVSSSEHLCSADMGSPSVEQVLRGTQP